jgi:hypothetical protein
MPESRLRLVSRLAWISVMVLVRRFSQVIFLKIPQRFTTDG